MLLREVRMAVYRACIEEALKQPFAESEGPGGLLWWAREKDEYGVSVYECDLKDRTYYIKRYSYPEVTRGVGTANIAELYRLSAATATGAPDRKCLGWRYISCRVSEDEYREQIPGAVHALMGFAVQDKGKP